MRAWHLIFIVLALGLWLFLRPPSAEKIAREMELSVEAGTVRYGAVVFTAEWGEPVTHAGDVRMVKRAWRRSLPIVTADLVLTTGEFSDLGLVETRWTGGGSMVWTAPKRPEGSLIVLHLVPRDALVSRALARLDEGDRVELVGREETRGRIEGSDGSYLRLGHANHRFLLVTEVIVR